MIGVLGLTLTVLGAASALYATIAAIRAARGGGTAELAYRAAWVAFAALVGANLVMVVALVTHDFSVAYVAQVGSRATPLLYTVASLWGALEGSILFWAGVLAGVTVLLLVRTRDANDRARLPISLAVLMALTAFFSLIVVGPGAPWRRLVPAPSDGPGPNPLLQDHPLMALHPPLLYIGFVGLAVPFALTVDALVRGQLDDRWLSLTRRWTLGPWVSLTLALMAGSWWSYAVLGWGGYWGWDPVENVALLPWLTATAFVHSAMVGRRGGRLLTWNVSLVAASFALTIFATMVTRSGILASVHAFTRSAIGTLFVGLLGAILVGTIGLMAVRLPPSTDVGRLGTRGRAILVNNLLLTAIAATVLLGTMFPLIAELVTADRLSVGAPYFERLIGPLGVGLPILVGIGPTLPWGAWSAGSRRALVPGTVVTALVAGALAVSGASPAMVVGGSAGVFALTQSVWLIGRRVRFASRHSTAGGRSRRSRVAIGGLLCHAGLGLLAIAVVASTIGTRETVVTVPVGGSATALGRSVTYVRSEERAGPGRTVLSAILEIDDGGGRIRLTPGLSLFASSTQAIATPAIAPGPIDDLYVTLMDADPTTSAATLRVGLHPLVSWIWPAGALIAFGGLLAMRRGPRRQPEGAWSPPTSERQVDIPAGAIDGLPH